MDRSAIQRTGKKQNLTPLQSARKFGQHKFSQHAILEDTGWIAERPRLIAKPSVVKLAGLESCFDRVVCDVCSKEVVMLRGPDKMVERLLLPEVTFGIEVLVDLYRSVVQP